MFDDLSLRSVLTTVALAVAVGFAMVSCGHFFEKVAATIPHPETQTERSARADLCAKLQATGPQLTFNNARWVDPIDGSQVAAPANAAEIERACL